MSRLDALTAAALSGLCSHGFAASDAHEPERVAARAVAIAKAADALLPVEESIEPAAPAPAPAATPKGKR